MATMYNEGYSIAIIEGLTLLYKDGKELLAIPNTLMMYVAHDKGIDKEANKLDEDGMVKVAKIIYNNPSLMETVLDVRTVAERDTGIYYTVILDQSGRMMCNKNSVKPGCILPFFPRNFEGKWLIHVNGRIASLPLEFQEKDVYSYVLHCPANHFKMLEEENIHNEDYMHLIRYILNSGKNSEITELVADIVSRQKAFLELTEDEALIILNEVYNCIPKESTYFLGNNRLDIAVLYAMLYLKEEGCIRHIKAYNVKIRNEKHYKFIKQCNDSMYDIMTFLRKRLL